ncbi:MAG: TrbC family F-type conjugative pilus assembly protein [Brevinematia bacterium]
MQVISFLQVNVEPDEKGEIKIYHQGNLWKTTKAKRTLDEVVDYVFMSSVKNFYSQLQSLEVGSSLTEEQKRKIKESLEKTSTVIRTKEYQEKIENATTELAKLLYGQDFQKPSFYEDFVKKKMFETVLSSDERIYVFVSESVPEDVLRSYIVSASSLNSSNVIFVLRGGKGGLTYLRPTVEWIYHLMKKDQDCDLLKEKCEVYPINFQIDPFLFKRYKINMVPAVVYVKGVESSIFYSEGLPETKIKSYYVSYGDVNFFYHLYVIGKASNNTKFINLSGKFLKY